MACLMRMFISLEVECHTLGSEPLVKEARIYRNKEGGVGSKAFFLGSRSRLSCTYTVHVNGIPKWNIRVPTTMGFVDFWRSI